MKLLVTGATGLVGAEVIRQAILNPRIKSITALTRKAPDIQDPKLQVVLHNDFLDYAGLETLFKTHDAIAWCLGISQSQVSKEQYQTITYAYTIAAAKAVQQMNPAMVFLFVSGMGADSTEKSSTLFARVKGQTENALLALGLQHLYMVRPAGIKPIHPNKNTAFTNKLMIPFFPILELLTPNMVITSVDLAKAILFLIENGYGKQLIENKELKSLL